MTEKISTKPKSRLGRGLSSLLSVTESPIQVDVSAPSPAPQELPTRSNESTLEPTVGTNSQDIEIALIQPNPHQPRKQWDDQSIAELAATLKTTGLIQPIIVRQTTDGYQLIAGERRLRAAKQAGLKTLPAIVRDVDAFAQAQMALVENIQRQDLNSIERAYAYKALISQLGLTQQELANRLGEDRSSIANYLRLLDLAEPVRQMIQDGKISLGQAKLLAGIPDVIEQERLANICVNQALAVRNLERLIQIGSSAQPEASAAAPSAHLQDLEKTISRELGMRVQVRSGSKKGRGRLIIHYSSLDQFDSLVQKLGITVE